MKNLTLLKILSLDYKIRRNNGSPLQSQDDSGYTLLELLVVVIIIGILGAIAVPGWLGFTEQRRVSAANETIYRAIQEAQSQAKARKLSYSVSILAPANEAPKVAVYQGTTPPDAADSRWKSLGQKNYRIWVGTNVDSANANDVNTAGTINPAPSTTTPTTKPVITFDYMGTLPPNPTPDLGANGLIISVVAAPSNISSFPNSSTRRCVVVNTILGSTRIGRINTTSSPYTCKAN